MSIKTTTLSAHIDRPTKFIRLHFHFITIYLLQPNSWWSRACVRDLFKRVYPSHTALVIIIFLEIYLFPLSLAPPLSLSFSFQLSSLPISLIPCSTVAKDRDGVPASSLSLDGGSEEWERTLATHMRPSTLASSRSLSRSVARGLARSNTPS